jgi:hypothetical protein
MAPRRSKNQTCWRRKLLTVTCESGASQRSTSASRRASFACFTDPRTIEFRAPVGLGGPRWAESCNTQMGKFSDFLALRFGMRLTPQTRSLTFLWDVRTKKVTYESVPTVDGIVGIANYGPTATLFSLGRNHTVQQYDLNPNARAPQLVQNVQHVPAKLPPSPPISDGDQGKAAGTVTAGAADPRAIYFEAESSGEEGVMTMSPLQRIAQEMDQLEDEKRDQLGALSPVSSRSSLSSRSAGGYGRPQRSRSSNSRRQLTKEKPPSPGMLSTGSSYGTGTTFSSGAWRAGGMPQPPQRESVSIRTISSSASTKSKSSRLRQEILQSPDEPKPITKELFPFTKARLTEVPFTIPVYDQNRRTPDDLRKQMLQVVFGWQEDVESLIRDEVARHQPGAPSAVLLSKWLGDLGSDTAASMVGSASLSSSDWMLLALSAMGSESQKKVGEAFVERLLAKGDTHPAVAILLGLGEPDEAIEAYVSSKHFMEAVLLTCLVFPLDWGRQSHLVRRWGEQLVSEEPKQPELAVRCFSCTSVESSEPWFSPRAQDAIYAAQQSILGPSPPLTGTMTLSPPNSATHPRMNPAQSGLKLITNFNPPQHLDPLTVIDDKTPMTYTTGGVTPIDSAAVLSPGGYYMRQPFRGDPASAASARTMTPGGGGAYERRRYPSRGALDRLRESREPMTPADETTIRTTAPTTAWKDRRSGSETSYGSTIHRARSASTGKGRTFSPTDRSISSSSYQPQVDRERGRGLPSPAQGVFTRLTEGNRARNGSRDRKPDGLSLHMDDLVLVDPPLPSGTTQTSYTMLTGGSAITGQGSIQSRSSRRTAQSANDADMKSSKIRSIDEYINSLEAAQNYGRERARSPSRHRGQSREGRSSRRAPSEGRGVRYIKPAKRSPSSPVSMSPDDPALLGAAAAATAAFEDERYYKLIAPVEAQTTRPSRGPDATSNSARAASKSRRRTESKERSTRMRSVSRSAKTRSSRPESPSREATGEVRGRSQVRGDGSVQREPSSGGSAQPNSSPDLSNDSKEPRARSTSRRPRERGTSHSRTRSPDRRPRERSKSARRPLSDVREVSIDRVDTRATSKSNMPRLVTNFSENSVLTKKELAAQELEARRLSLARRPSAPAIPHPAELSTSRIAEAAEPTSARSPTGSPGMPIPNERQLMRSMSVDPDMLFRGASATTGVSTSSAPIGLPATPRAMRHPKYMTGSPEDAPAVPEIPQSFVQAQSASANASANVSAEPSPDKQGPPSPPMMLLPATTFEPGRSSSAPIEKWLQAAGQRPGSSRPSHARKLSSEYQAIHPPTGSGSAVASPAIGSIEEALAGGSEQNMDNIVIVEASPLAAQPQSVLPELQHLAGPPPPPPPPTMFRGHMASNSLGIIDSADMRHATPAAMLAPRQATPVLDVQPPPVSSSPQTHRRGRGSVSETMGQKLRNVTTRLRERSASRNRIRSPPEPTTYTPAPYESIQPSINRAKSPPQSTTHSPAPYESIQPSMPPQRRGSTSTAQTRSPAVDKGTFTMPYDSTYVSSAPPTDAITRASTAPPIDALPQTTYGGGYRNPKEIARQMAAEATAAEAAPPKSTTPYLGYRNPKEIRANMPPEYTQMGVEPAAGENN